MAAVPEFGRALIRPLGCPVGPIEAFIEVPFELGDATVRPDGLLRVTRGQRTWTALVEVKTGTNVLSASQLASYLDVAKDRSFDAVISISNEIPPAAGVHPTPMDKRKLKKVDLHHWSWSDVLTQAIMQKEHRGVSDPDQAWILGELIRYLEHEKSGALEFQDMGQFWVPVRDAVKSGTFRATTKGATEFVSRFDGLLRYIGLKLGRRLGTDVVIGLTRKEAQDPMLRANVLLQSLTENGSLAGALKIPATVGPITVTADIRAGQVICTIDLDAPRDRRSTARVTWVLRQLKAAPDTTRLESFFLHGRTAGAASLLKDARNSPTTLAPDAHRDLRYFRIACSSKLGTKAGHRSGSFIDSITNAVDAFYENIVQNLKPWAASPPKLRPDTHDDITSAATTPIVADDLTAHAREANHVDALPPQYGLQGGHVASTQPHVASPPPR